MTRRALILFAHGARDARWAEPFKRLQAQVQASLPEVGVHLAFLELMQPNLPELVSQLMATGTEQVTLVPVFLAQGGHLLRDLPLLVEQLRRQYPAVQLDVARAIGEDDGVIKAIADYCVHSVAVS